MGHCTAWRFCPCTKKVCYICKLNFHQQIEFKFSVEKESFSIWYTDKRIGNWVLCRSQQSCDCQINVFFCYFWPLSCSLEDLIDVGAVWPVALAVGAWGRGYRCNRNRLLAGYQDETLTSFKKQDADFYILECRLEQTGLWSVHTNCR